MCRNTDVSGWETSHWNVLTLLSTIDGDGKDSADNDIGQGPGESGGLQYRTSVSVEDNTAWIREELNGIPLRSSWLRLGYGPA